MLVSSGLFAESRFRRLFKARHQEMKTMEIRTKSLTASLVTDPTNPFTVYKLQIKSKVRQADTGEWTLEKRYSEFARFRENYLRSIRKWEEALDSRMKRSKAFVLISNSLRKPITPDFPRKHMRCDTKEIIRERRAGLQDFLRKLLDVYADISVYIYNKASYSAKESKVYTQLHEIFLDLERFLDIPAVQKEVERVQVAAILSLEDVDDEEGQGEEERGEANPEDEDDDEAENCGPVCCICLTGSARREEQRAADKMVKLPCAHKFHEDCVIDWFNASTTCPLCRQNSISQSSPAVSELSV